MKLIKDILKSKPDKTLHIYQRVSTEIQKTDGGSLDTQLKNGIKTAEKLKYNYMVWDEGAKSGSRNQEDRNVFNMMMLEVKQGNIKHIYFQDITRSQRNYDYEYFLIKTCMDYDCEIHDNGRKYDLNNPQDNFFLRLQSLFGQYENQQRRLRSVMGKRDHFLRGGWRGGITPFGYDTVDRKLEINKEESVWIKKMFDLYASGKTTTHISNLLFSNGVKPRKSKSGIFNVGTVASMLKNEIYIGIDRMIDPDDRDLIHTYKGVPKLVDKKVFDKCQKFLKLNKRSNTPTKSTTYPVMLRKMIYCDSCGEMWGVRIQHRTKSYAYYCRNKENSWSSRSPNKTIKECGVKRSCNIPQLDELVWNNIVDVNKESHILKEKDKSKILQPINPNKSRSWKQRINYLEKTNKGLEEKKAFLYEQFISNDITKGELTALSRTIKQQIIVNQKDIEELQHRMNNKHQQDGFIDWVKRRQHKIKDMESITDVNEKITLMKEFVQRVEMNHNKKTNKFVVTMKLNLPLFDDKLVWKNKNDKSKGYSIQEGSYTKSFDFEVVLGRGKKKLKNDGSIDDTKKKKQLITTIETNRLQWNDFYCSDSFLHKKPYLTYDIVVESSKLNIPKLSDNQLYLFHNICELRKEGLTYKQVAVKLNELGIPPTRGKVGTQTAQKVWSSYTKIKRNLDRKDTVFPPDVDDIEITWK